MIDRSAQERITLYHQQPTPLLDRSISSTGGQGNNEGIIVNECSGFVGIASKRSPFLPHFEYQVEGFYVVRVNGRFSPGIDYDTLTVGDRVVELPRLRNPFDVRASGKEGLTFLMDANGGSLPREFKDGDVEAEFSFKLVSSPLGGIIAHMPVNHPTAEAVIERYLHSVAESFASYEALAGRHNADKSIDEQPRAYQRLRGRLHDILVGRLQSIFEEARIKPRIIH